MTGRSHTSREEPLMRLDILTPEEEAVLAALREAVVVLRANGLATGPSQAADVASSVGAKPCGFAESDGALAFKIGRVRFSLQSAPGPDDRLEVRFTADEK
jgi:hypothetical protein